MVLNNIEALLEKYDNGETSLKEEQQLKTYFAQETVAPHLESYKVMFQHFNSEQQEQFTKNLPLQSKKSTLRRWLSVAAVAVLMVSIYTQVDTKKGLDSLSKDELLAYNQTIKALNLVSTKLNEGSKGLNTLALATENFEKGAKHIYYVDEFTKTTNKILK